MAAPEPETLPTSLVPDGHAAVTWLRDTLPNDESRRHAGGLLLEIDSRDPWSAVDEARVIVARANARVKVTSPSDDSIRLNGWTRVAGDRRSYEIRPTPRQIEIGSLIRQSAIYRFDGGLPPATDDAVAGDTVLVGVQYPRIERECEDV